MTELESMLKESTTMINWEEALGNAFQMQIPTCFVPNIPIPTHVRTINTHAQKEYHKSVWSSFTRIYSKIREKPESPAAGQEKKLV